MMNININSPMDVRNAGMQALVVALGPVGCARFIQQFDNGYGNYTKEKYQIPDTPMDDLIAELLSVQNA